LLWQWPHDRLLLLLLLRGRRCLHAHWCWLLLLLLWWGLYVCQVGWQACPVGRAAERSRAAVMMVAVMTSVLRTYWVRAVGGAVSQRARIVLQYCRQVKIALQVEGARGQLSITHTTHVGHKECTMQSFYAVAHAIDKGE
jgi:hypothetical protein